MLSKCHRQCSRPALIPLYRLANRGWICDNLQYCRLGSTTPKLIINQHQQGLKNCHIAGDQNSVDMQRSLLDVLIPDCHCSATSTRICVKFDANVVISNTPNPANLLDWRWHASKVSSGVKPEMRSDHGMMYSQPRSQLVGGSTGLLPTLQCNIGLEIRLVLS
jgi:hypothetical protein